LASVRWSLNAQRNLRDIIQYLAESSSSAPEQLLNSRSAAIETLEMSGRVVDEYDDDELREVIVANYRVIYLYREDSVGIVAITHGRRDLPRALGSDPRGTLQ
jgi:plasmid stabilization system protein ParE